MSIFEHFSALNNTMVFSNSNNSNMEAVDWHVEYEEANSALQQDPLSPSTSSEQTQPKTLWEHWAGSDTSEEQFAAGPPYDFFGGPGAEIPEVETALSFEEPIINTAEVLSETSGSMLLGIAGATLAEGLASHQAMLDTNKDMLGEGVAGHSFAASYQARSDASHDNLVGAENAAMIGAGSMLGPWGTAAGMLAGAVNSVFNQNPTITVTTNTGDQISPTD